MSKVYALYEVDEPPLRNDKLIEEFDSYAEAKENLDCLNKYCEGKYYIQEQEEQPYRWLENADCFCYGEVD